MALSLRQLRLERAMSALQNDHGPSAVVAVTRSEAARRRLIAQASRLENEAAASGDPRRAALAAALKWAL